jgi:hypothetical protein
MRPDYDNSEDEDDEFVFDFVSSNQTSSAVGQASTSASSTTIAAQASEPTETDSNKPQSSDRISEKQNQPCDDENWDESNENSYTDNIVTNTPAVVYQLKNNYFFDEAEIQLKELKEAICASNLEQVKSLMKKNNMNVNCRLKSNWSPLMYAVTCGSFTMTSYFVENGADINFDDGFYLKHVYF